MISNLKVFCKNDETWVKRYSCNISKGRDLFLIQMETDGFFRPHLTKDQFSDLVKEYF